MYLFNPENSNLISKNKTDTLKQDHLEYVHEL